MADNLKVDVNGLIRGGEDISEQATALLTAHAQAIAGLSDAELGWVGSSADALVRMADAWQRLTDGHHTALTEQSAHIADAARGFESQDECSAAELARDGDRGCAVK
jgi:hypothetical protein